MDTQNNSDALARMRELVGILNVAGESYYQHDIQAMPDYRYDKLADELAALEAQTGIILASSPSVNVGYSIISALEKVTHEQPLLSLGKTKDIDRLLEFIGEQKCLISWKLDGLTVVASYTDGRLTQALTRGNGTIGEDITHNAMVFRNIPRVISYKSPLNVRGEAIITFADFERINSELGAEAEKYKNTRNLTSGSVRQLNSQITAQRSVMYYAFSLSVSGNGVEPGTDSKEEQLKFLQSQGFDVAPYVVVDANNALAVVDEFKAAVTTLPYATDGLVVTYDSIAHSRSLGQTSKFPHDSLAFKWADETAETTLIDVSWNTSRTGLINPVAVFEPVQLEGSTVRQASLHNVSIIESLQLGIGDRITVYKANMIIPQVAENFTRSGSLPIPEHCPVCASNTQMLDEHGVKTLICPNPACRAQLVRALAHYVSRDASNIEGLSEATIEKLVEAGFLNNYADIYRLGEHKANITILDGMGEKSFAKLEAAIEKSKTIELSAFIHALGISQIGTESAKLLTTHLNSLDAIISATNEDLVAIPGFGEKTAAAVVEYFAAPANKAVLTEALPYLTLTLSAPIVDGKFSGKTFVITGNLNIYENRKQLQQHIERQGGKIASSVSNQTTYLINNNSASASAKNKKARELGVTIITEAEFDEL